MAKATAEIDRPPRGVKTKLLGVILILLGMLDGMLSWRGGYPAGDFHLLLFASGVLLYLMGAIRSGAGAGGRMDRKGRVT